MNRCLFLPCLLLVACSGASATDGAADGGVGGSNRGSGGSSSSGSDSGGSSGPGIGLPEAGSHDGSAPTDAGTHDASVPSEAGKTEAGSTPDAGAPADATAPIEGGAEASAPACVGQWTMIPPLSVAGTAVAKYDMMTTDGSTVYVAYSRPSDTTYFDVAAYSPSSGWTAYQSTAPDDTTAQGHRPMAGVVENGHLAGYSVESDASIWREVFDLGTQAWTSSNTGSLQPQRSTIAYTNSWLVFEGAYDSPGASMCETQASTLTFPIDATSTATAPEGDDSPLGSLAEPYAVATTDHVFFFGGYNIPADSPGCNVSEPRTPLYNGAFYDPATGIWSTSVPLGPSAGSDFVDFAFAALPTGQVVVLENYTSIFGRADILAPGQTAFTAGPILPAGLWGRIDTSDDYATLAGTAAGVVVWSSGTNDGVLYDPTTNTATPICAPPGTVSNTFMASTPTGVVLLGDGQAGTSSTTSQSAYLSF